MNTDIKNIGERMLTQSNRATQYPIFIIVENKKIFGVDSNFACDGKERKDTDSINFKNDLCTKCTDAYEENGELPEECDEFDCDDSFVHYRIEEDVPNLTAGFFFTEEACKAHLASNAHHYSNPSTYVICAWRNPEMVAVMQHMISLTGKEIPSHYR